MARLTAIASPAFRRISLLSLLALLLVGTSKPLAFKYLTGVTADVPEGLVSPESPQATFGEHVDNQGCFTTQMLNLSVEFKVRNDRETTVEIPTKNATITADGEPQPLNAFQYTVDGQTHVREFETVEIAPGTTEEINLRSLKFMPFEALETTDEIEVVFPVDGAPLVLRFEDIRQVEAVTR